MQHIDSHDTQIDGRTKRSWRPKLFGGLIILLGIAIFFVTRHLPHPAVHWMLYTGVPNQSDMWVNRLQRNLPTVMEIVKTGDVSTEENIYLNAAAQTSDVFSITLIRKDGQVMWSNEEHSPAGSQISDTGYHDVLTNQEPCYDLQHVGHDSHQHEDFDMPISGSTEFSDHTIFHIYYPLFEHGELVGMVHFISDFTQLHNDFLNRFTAVLIAIQAFVVLTLAASLFYIFHAARKKEQSYIKQSERERAWVENQITLTREVRLISELNEWLQSSKSLNELFDMVANFMTTLLPDCEGSLYVYSNSRDVLDGSVSWNNGQHREHIHPDDCWGLRRGRPYFYGQSEVSFTCNHVQDDAVRPYYCLPILAHGETVGLLHLRATPEVSTEQFEATRKLARLTAEQISMAIANARMRDQLQDQSIRDPLTGLFNRRHLTESLRRLIRQCERSKTPLALVSIDVDHFKKFNDNHGHDAGDMVLRAVGSTLEQACDRDETACRFGGEEFMLLIPNVSQSNILKRAEDIRKAVSAISVRYGERNLPHITISVGIAMFPQHGDIPQDLMASADTALYRAKALGRNQIVLAGDIPEPVNALVEQISNQKNDTGETDAA